MLYSVKINSLYVNFQNMSQIDGCLKEFKTIGSQSNKIKGLSKRNQQSNYTLLEVENKDGNKPKRGLIYVSF